MTLSASEVRLLQAARKLIEGGETISTSYGSVIEGHDVALSMALDECKKYFRGSYAAYRLSKERILRRLRGTNWFWVDDLLKNAGYYVWKNIDYGNGAGRIVPGNISEETFNNWKVLANLAYIDRILETGEIK